MKNQILGILLGTFLLSSCASGPKLDQSDYSVQLTEILEQISEAIISAKEMVSGKVPEISSVKLDLQVEASSMSDAKVPILLVTAEGMKNRENMHRISVSFRPTAKYSDPSVERKKIADELATSIGQIYQVVAQAGPYQFQKGSVQIQCTFRVGAGLSVKTARLVPIPLGKSYNRQSIQTITLQFEPAKDNMLPGATVSEEKTPSLSLSPLDRETEEESLDSLY